MVVLFDDGDKWSVDSRKLKMASGSLVGASPAAKAPASQVSKKQRSHKRGSTPVDLLLLAFFAFSLFGNITVDIWMGMDVDLQTTGWSIHKTVYKMGHDFDPLFLDNSFYMRYSALVTAVLFLPYYVLAIRALLTGEGLGIPGSVTRKLAKVYAIGMSANMCIVFMMEAMEAMKQSRLSPKLGLYWVTVVPYLVVPVLVLQRLKHEMALPKGRKA